MSVLQLCVLIGPNAGAVCRLPAGDYLIGASEQCDFVLADAQVSAEHVKLRVGEDLSVHVDVLAEGVYMDGESIAADEEFVYPLMTPLQVGESVLAIGHDDADWSSMRASRLEIKLPPEELAAQETALPGDDHEASADDDPVDADAPTAPSVRKNRILNPVSACALMGLAFLGVAVSFILKPDMASAPVVEASDPLEAVREAVTGLPGGDRLNIFRQNDRVVVQGVLPNYSMLVQLRNRLRDVNVRVLLRVHSLENLLMTIDDFLTDLNSPLESFAYDGGAAVGIRGCLPTKSDVELLRRLLERDLPWVAVNYDHIETSESVIAFVQERLAAEELALSVNIEYKERELVFSGGLTTPQQRGRLDGIIDAAIERCGGNIAMVDKVRYLDQSQTPTGGQSTSSASDSLPAARIFSIIVSGERRFVRDNFGNRYSIGDKLPDGFLITDIEADIVTAVNEGSVKQYSIRR